jgi:hypothetical protein
MITEERRKSDLFDGMDGNPKRVTGDAFQKRLPRKWW